MPYSCMDFISPLLFSDLQVLLASFMFGIGFIGQRAISMGVFGLGPNTCNTLRFGLSTLLLIAVLPIIHNTSHTKKTSSNDKNSAIGLYTDQSIGKTTSDSGTSIGTVLDNDDKNIKSDSNHVLIQLFGSYFGELLAGSNKILIIWGIFLGVLNFMASSFQQWGITLTSASKAAFIAGFDLFLTPILTYFLPTFKRNGRPQLVTWIAVIISITGLYLLSSSEDVVSKKIFHNALPLHLNQTFILNNTTSEVTTNQSVEILKQEIALLIEIELEYQIHPKHTTHPTFLPSPISIFDSSAITSTITSTSENLGGGVGEGLVFISTFFWTLHIVYTDLSTHYIPDTLNMMTIQLATVTLLSFITSLLFESQYWIWWNIIPQVPWLLFLAITEGIGFTLMASGQQHSPPSHAALILSLEGVFAAVAGNIFLQETLNQMELLGCCLMLLATVVVKIGSMPTEWCESIVSGHKTQKGSTKSGSYEQSDQNGSGSSHLLPLPTPLSNSHPMDIET